MTSSVRANVEQTTAELNNYLQIMKSVDALKEKIAEFDAVPSEGKELKKTKKAVEKQLKTLENGELKKCLEKMSRFRFLYVTNENELAGAKRYKAEEKSYITFVVERDREDLTAHLDDDEWLPALPYAT